VSVVFSADSTFRRIAVTAVLLAGIGGGTAACAAGGPGHVMVGHGPTARAVELGAPMSASKPVRLRIASAGVDAGPVLELGHDDRQQLQGPPVDQADKPGWYTGSVTPGEKGVSVLLAHFNTATGPGLLRNMPLLKAGDTIEVRRRDGRTAAFVVRKIEKVSKEKVTVRDLRPASEHAELRLVVSGKNIRIHYNVVFHADLRK
jgi:hypothetical protein